jgi:hypothetical protein
MLIVNKILDDLYENNTFQIIIIVQIVLNKYIQMHC